MFGKINLFEVFPSKNIISIKPHELNGEKFFNCIKEYKPDIAFIFGVDLMKEELINILLRNQINIHLCLSTCYRGSATLFWPFYFLEPQFAGITLYQIERRAEPGRLYIKQHHSFTKKIKSMMLELDTFLVQSRRLNRF